MSNKNVNYKNSNNKNFINNTQKPKKKKFSLSQKIVLILMIFWTVCSCLSVFATAQSCSIAKADDSSISTVSDISDTVFNPLDYPSANLIDVESMVGGILYKEEFNDYYMLKSDNTYLFSDYFYCNLPAGTYFSNYTLVDSNVSHAMSMYFYYDDGTSFSYPLIWQNNGRSFTLNKPVVSTRLFLSFDDPIGSYIAFKDLMLNAGSVGYPYQPYFGDIYKAGEEVGKQQALDSANYGYFYNATVDITVNKTDGSTVNLTGLVPDYVYGGISFNSIYSYLVNNSYTANTSSISIDLMFALPVNLQTFIIDSPLYGSGNISFFEIVGFLVFSDSFYLTIGNFDTDEGTSSYKFILDSINGYTDSVSYMRSSNFPISYLNNLSFFISNPAYQLGYEVGYSNGEVSSDSYNIGYNNGKKVGYQDGYSAGVNGANQYSFLSLLGAVVDAPVSVLSDMLNFDLLGFNMSSFFFALITLGLIIAVIRIFI